MRGSQFQLALEVGVIEIDRSGGGVNSLGSKSKLDRRTYLKHIYWQDVGQPQRLQLVRLCIPCRLRIWSYDKRLECRRSVVNVQEE